MKKYNIFSLCCYGYSQGWKLLCDIIVYVIKKIFPVFDIANQLLTNNSPSTKEKPKVRYLLPLVIAFLVAENEKQQLEDWPQANLGYVPERLRCL